MCTNPYFVPHLGFSVPCGQCMSCRIARAREWTERMVHEAEYWDSSVFVTLTYSDTPENTKHRYSLNPDHLKNYLKRLRYFIAPKKVSYYAVGEYGGSHGAAHFHLIIFGLHACGECEQCSKVGRVRRYVPKSDTECGAIARSWTAGFVDVRGVGPESIGYVSKYLTKSDSRELGDRVAPFARQSKGLGLKWLLDRKEQVWKEKGLRKHGHLIGLPRYYVKAMDRLFSPRPDLIGKSLPILRQNMETYSLASWMVQRTRWRLAQENEWDKAKVLAKRGIEWYDGFEQARIRRQVDRNVRSSVAMKERQQ